MDASDLYGLPLDRFTPERNALAADLRRAGDREQARRVAKLHKPSVAAWAINQLIRTQRKDIRALFETGDAAQRAQTELLEGRGDADGLRDAADAERQAVERLTQTARGLLSSQGQELSQAKLQQVSETLHAAALDPEARDQVKGGCLERELRHVGLGGLSPSLGPGQPTRAARPKAAPRDRAAQLGRQRTSRATEPSGPWSVEQLRAARQAEGATRRRAERAARELRRAEQHRAQAAEGLRAAERQLVDARDRAAQAEHEHQRAQQELKQLKRLDPR